MFRIFREKLKENILLIVSISLCMAFTVFFFGPVEIILSSPSEFWFSVIDILPIILISTLMCFCAIFGILSLFLLISKKVFIIGTSIVSGITFALYIQGNWTFVDYGKMDGTTIDWSKYNTWSLVNTGIWIFILLFVVILFFFYKNFNKVYAYILYGIVGIEVITLGTLCITTPNIENKEVYFSSKGELDLSSENNNILVILADGFDGMDFLPVLSEEPELKSYFDGFTFYEDTCGTSYYSQESGITLLTGNQFEVGLSFSENVDKAYENTILYDELIKNNYSIDLYLSDQTMVSEYVFDKVDNVLDNKAELSGFGEVFVGIYKMVAFRYMPHILKQFFWYSSMDFGALKSSDAFSWSNIDLYNLIKTSGVQVDNTGKNVYQFYWIQGPHVPIVMDRYCRVLEENSEVSEEQYSNAQFEQTIGVVRLFGELISSLKDVGVYDNTTIIFCSDHGWDMRSNPLLLVKPANIRGEMQISTVPVSMIEDYLPTLLYFITGTKEYGNTIYELNNSMKRNRLFYVYDINDQDRTYNDRQTLYFKEHAFSKRYILGESLNPDEIVLYGVRGLSQSESNHIWTDGKETEMFFKMEENFEALELQLEYEVFTEKQEVFIYANDKLIAHYNAMEIEKKEFVIPKEYLLDGELLLRFEFPNAISPKELGISEDSRVLALAMKSLTLTSISEEE